MAKTPSIFGINNPLLYTNPPVGAAVPGIKAVRARAKATIKANSNPYKIGSSRFPNGKKAK